MFAKPDSLEKCINEFISGIIDGRSFERMYSDIFDFEEGEIELSDFRTIRGFLEHFSPYDTDLNKHPQFYISEEQLRQKVIALKET